MVCVCFFSTWQFKCSCVLFTNLFCIQNPVGRHYFMQKKQKSQKCSSYFCVAKCSTLCEHVVFYAFMDLQQDYAVTEIKWKHKNGYLFFFFVVFLLSNKTCGKFLAVPSKKRSPDFSAVSNKSTGWHCDSSRKKKDENNVCSLNYWKEGQGVAWLQWAWDVWNFTCIAMAWGCDSIFGSVA